MTAKATAWTKTGWCLLGLALGGFLGAKGATNLAQAREQMFAIRDGQEQGLIRALEGQRMLLLAKFQQVTVLYEPCALTVARGLATVAPGPALGGAPECAAWIVPAEIEPVRVGTIPSLALHGDRNGAVHSVLVASQVPFSPVGPGMIAPSARPPAPALAPALVDGAQP